ncbi:Uma2 family endonuclease [Candidatus Bipolaricaulota bacterium]|nr:Uma2 family endonuclease [Candidatus Bipolaricaulota bacterium]
MAELNTKIKFTYTDYKSLPESETDRYELLQGELVMVPSPNWLHQSILKRILLFIDDYVTSHGLGEVRFAPLDIVLSEEVVLQPDIFFISRERSEIIADEGVHGAPDLVVEITSPGTKARDQTLKRTLYARHGVKEYWIVDPEAKTVEVLTLEEKGFELFSAYKGTELLNSPLLKGLAIDLRKVFEIGH